MGQGPGTPGFEPVWFDDRVPRFDGSPDRPNIGSQDFGFLPQGRAFTQGCLPVRLGLAFLLCFRRAFPIFAIASSDRLYRFLPNEIL